jgi:hypothetical protein
MPVHVAGSLVAGQRAQLMGASLSSTCPGSKARTPCRLPALRERLGPGDSTLARASPRPPCRSCGYCWRPMLLSVHTFASALTVAVS